MPGACELAEWNVPHAPHEHRSLLVEIDEDGEEGLAGASNSEKYSLSGYQESWR